MPPADSTRPIVLARFEGTAAAARADAIAVEEPLEIRVAGRSVAVVMRTPGHDRELAAGFLVAEGIVRRRDDVLDVVFCGEPAAQPSAGAVANAAGGSRAPGPIENTVDVLLAPGVAVDWARLTRNVFTSSSCGVCSKASIESVRAQFAPIAVPLAPRREVVAALPDQLRAAQAAFTATGGLHGCALFDAAGGLRAVREDVGRHNALDKVIGHAFFADTLPLAGHIVLVSGRVSFELVQKALAAGVPCLAAISAPTSAAVELARESGMTLVGFLRGARMNVYAGTLAG
jgi:FdhD protein